MNKINYGAMIDHTYLKPEATQKEIDKLIAEGLQYKFKTVCVNPTWASYVKKQISGQDLGLTVVVGFPLGANTTIMKVQEAKEAVANGADEIDMVINIGHLKDQRYDLIIAEIKAIKQAIHPRILKVIIETALLTNQEIQKATQLVIDGQADFVKTSTGFSSRGSSFEDIKIMHQITQGKIGIKASGGIKTYADLVKMVQLGATRIGTSSGVQLLNHQNDAVNY